MKEVTFFILPIILLYLPWGIRNLVYTGNPFFPFFYSVFGFKNVAWTTETASGYFSLLTEYQNKSVILTEIIKFPLNVINSPLKYGGGMDILGDFGWVVFFVIVPVVFIIKGFFNKVKNNISLYTMIVYIIGYFLLWFITKPVLRFLVPLSPFISVLSGLVFVEVLKFKINFVKITICFILFLFTLSNFLVYCSFQDVVKQFGVAVGLETKDEYLTKRLRNSPYPVLKFINENLDVQDTIFFVGEQRTFYCKKRFITSNLFAKNQLVKWADESVDVQEMLEKMKLEGITHILYNAEEGKRLESYGIFNFTENGRKNWETLLKKIKLLYSYNNVFLYSLM